MVEYRVCIENTTKTALSFPMDDLGPSSWLLDFANSNNDVFEQYCKLTPAFVEISAVSGDTPSPCDENPESSIFLVRSDSHASTSFPPSTTSPNTLPLTWLQPFSPDQITSPVSTLSPRSSPITAICSPVQCLEPSNHAIFSESNICEGYCATMAEREHRRKERRREQNRSSQRRFRASKEAKIKKGEEHARVLEHKLNRLLRRYKDLEDETERLRARVGLLGLDSKVESLPEGSFAKVGHDLIRASMHSVIRAAAERESNPTCQKTYRPDKANYMEVPYEALALIGFSRILGTTPYTTVRTPVSMKECRDTACSMEAYVEDD